MGDVSTNFFRNRGYNHIQFPSENVRLYDILLRQPGKSETLIVGNLEGFIASSGRDFPPISLNIKVPDLEGEKLKELQIDFGLGFLEGVGDFLSALGSIGGELKIGLEKAQNVRYAYKNVSKEVIKLRLLDKFLQEGAKPKRIEGPFVTFFEEIGTAFIITEILKSNQFEVEAYNEDGSVLEVDVNPFFEAISTNISVSRGSNSNTELVYRGQTKIAFAFKAVPIWLDKTIPRFKIVPIEGINIPEG